MSTNQKQLNDEVAAPVEPDALHDDSHFRGKGRHLVADLSGFFTNRKHGRGGLYLPVGRVEREG